MGGRSHARGKILDTRTQRRGSLSLWRTNPQEDLTLFIFFIISTHLITHNNGLPYDIPYMSMMCFYPSAPYSLLSLLPYTDPPVLLSWFLISLLPTQSFSVCDPTCLIRLAYMNASEGFFTGTWATPLKKTRSLPSTP